MGKTPQENTPMRGPVVHEDGADVVDMSKDVHTDNKMPIFQYPATPVTRLPLADLIANTEDIFNRQPPRDQTPVDRILWVNGPTSSQPTSHGTPTTRRKKRARSSSPTGSQNETSIHLESEPPGSFDLQPLSKHLKTSPHNDPLAELWNKYAEGNVRKGDSAPNPAFARLMSSPLTPGKRRDAIGFQRSASCGMEWPMSKAKRRRVEAGESFDKVKDIFARARSDLLEPSKSKSSKVQLLVEKIQESLNRAPRADPDAPSSSSPLPERNQGERQSERSSTSPTRNKALEIPNKIERETSGQIIESQNEEDSDETPQSETLRADRGSSEFGDADLDIDLLEAVELGDLVGKVGLGLVNPEQDNMEHLVLETNLEVSFQASEVLPLVRAVDVPQSNDTTPHGNSFDEFDDDDDDGFVADLEELAATFDSQQNQPDANQGQIYQREQVMNHLQPSLHSYDGVADKPVAVTGPCVEAYLENDSGDEFGDHDVDLESFAAVENVMAAHGMTESPSQSRTSKDTRAIKRYLITNIADGQYQDDRGRMQPEKVLLVQDEKTKMSKAVMLRQSWYDSPCTIGAYIHIIGNFNSTGQCIVNDAQHMLILHPDHLVSATVVADSFECTRRAVLQDRVKSTSETTRPLVYGSILHEVFQEAMKVNKWDLEFLKSTIEIVVSRYLESLFELQLSVPEAEDYLMSKMPELKAWAEIFVAPKPKMEGVVKDRNGTQAKMSINKLLDVEEHVWSPMYGLKGNIDATVQVVMQDGKDQKILTVPFEVKTGKNATASHRAQTALYNLLLSDRYDLEVAYGILYYMENSETFRVRGIRNEIRQMIIQRNELACYVRNRLELPPMLKRPHLCDRCYAKTTCFMYHRLNENGDGETSGLGEKFDQVVGHLRPSHQEFFKKWDDLLTKEERDMFRFRRELWTMLSSERETLGRCFSNVLIEPGSAYIEEDGPKINRFRYTFNKQNSAPTFSFSDSQITVGEPIVISDEKGHFALANGYVTHVRPKRVTVAIDRKLHNSRLKKADFDADRNQSFTGIMEIGRDGGQLSTLTPADSGEQVLYRLDKDEFSNGMATARNNIIRMMEKDLYRARELRDLIIDGKAPEFRNRPAKYSVSGPASQANINGDQHRVIEKVMNAKDYALVLGMPGTGKTTTIAHIIRALASQGKSVLLTSYTHTAVDNILLKIRDDNIKILRLGAVAKVHPEVQQFADLAGIPKKSLDELKVLYEQSKVVATTCLGVNHPLFNQRLFDYCIVDEASQITLPVCLGPIRMAKIFILVGDHYQLPPLVQNKEAADGGLDISLFKLLSDSQPSSVVSLEHQYRMCADVMALSNSLIYSGRLKCGNAGVASRALTIPNISALQTHHHNLTSLLSSPKKTQSICQGSSSPSCWLSALLNPLSKVVFANTDPLLPLSIETAQGPRVVNAVEAILISQYVESLITCGVSPREIGVITFYRSQLSLLKQHLRHRIPDGLEMHTADKFQGRDKEVVVLSCVRSNDQRNVGDLLKDWRRVNVSVTRARSKLVLFGSMGTLRDSGVETLRRLVELVDEKGWVFDLPKSAAESHVFEENITQGSGRTGLGLAWGSPEKRKSPNKVSTSPVKMRGLGGSPKKNGMKRPKKVGRGMDIEKMLGGGKRPVLRDVVNEFLG